MTTDHAERKLAAIFAADVEGYSRLMGIDEVGTLRTLTAYRQIIDNLIAQHRGRIFNAAGDSVLAEFASVVDAVQCAVEVQRTLAEENSKAFAEQQMRLRIGVHVGDVLVQGENLFGDGVNIAARLESLAEPGGICVSGQVRDYIGRKLPVAFMESGEQRLKNIDESVRVWRVQRNSIARSTPRHSGSKARRRPAPARMSIVVLPFVNLSNDPEQEYFADGVTESLTTDLSRISGSFVIARNTAFTYKGRAVDVKKVGRELGVCYVLEGSVQRGGERVRVSAQLLDTRTGAHLWGDRFDKARGDILELQDEITGRIAQTLDIALAEAESCRILREQASNPDAVDLTLRGWAIFNRLRSPENNREARALFAQAVALDPRAEDAWAGIARTHATDIGNQFSDAPAEQLEQGEDAVARALALNPRHAIAHLARGILLNVRGRFDEAINAVEASIAANRNLAMSAYMLGVTKILVGRPDEAIAPIEQAIRLSPRDGQYTQFLFSLGRAQYMRGRDLDAIDLFQRSISAAPAYLPAHIWLAGAYASSGLAENARAEVAEVKRLRPDCTILRYRSKGLAQTHPIYLEKTARLWAGLRNAGLPER